MLPARLDSRTGSPSREQVDELADEHLDVLRRVVAGAGGDRLEPADVAVVVGAEHVDARVEAAVALVEVVRGVGGEVGEVAVGLDEDAVLVVTEVGGAQPHRAVGVEDVALLAQRVHRLASTAAAVVQRPLGEPHVEVRAERVEHAALLRRAAAVAAVAERDDAARRSASSRIDGSRVDDLLGEHRGRTRRGSRPRGSARRSRRASASRPNLSICTPASLT